MTRRRFIPGSQAGEYFANGNNIAAARLLATNYYRTGSAVQEAQEMGADDWEGGERTEDTDGWTPVQQFAYLHGWRTGHTRCDCTVAVPPEYKTYYMNDLPDSFDDW